VQWSLRQPDLFAAIFMRVPILGPWKRIPSLIDLTPNGVPKTVPTDKDTLPDGRTLYNDDTDVTAWILKDCSRNLPFLSWSSGRRDTGLPERRMWSYAVEMANALERCHYWFAFIWNNGVHDSVTGRLETRLLEEYQTTFARNLSYPAFTRFTLNNRYGNGDPTDGDLSGCVNCGWKWKVLADTPAYWSVSFMNSDANRPATTEVTPRNVQQFKLVPNQTITWLTSSGQGGKATADSYGLVTVTGVPVSPQSSTVLTIRSVATRIR
jgi:hypothetical protein